MSDDVEMLRVRARLLRKLGISPDEGAAAMEEAATTIATLRMEIAYLREPDDRDATISAHAQTIATLRKALEPFAKEADNWNHYADNSHANPKSINVAHLRQARAALQGNSPAAEDQRSVGEWLDALDRAALQGNSTEKEKPNG